MGGVKVPYRDHDGNERWKDARIIDYEYATNNDWLTVNQFTVMERRRRRRADVVLFVNGLPNGVETAAVRVTQGVLKSCDVLIGMDIINKGDFAVTNRGGVTMLSFQMPSLNHIDFVEMLEERKRNGIWHRHIEETIFPKTRNLVRAARRLI